MKKIFVFALGVVSASALLAGTAVDLGSTVYRPGVMMVKFPLGDANGYPKDVKKQPNLARGLLSIVNADKARYEPLSERVPEPVMALFSVGRSTAPVNYPKSSKKWSWGEKFTVFAHEGEIFLRKGDVFCGYGRFDDGAAIEIDGRMVFNQGDTSGYDGAPATFEKYIAPADGYVPFRAWIWDWAHDKNIVKCCYALQWNADGIMDDFENKSKWKSFTDPGDGSLLRTATDERFTRIYSLERGSVASGPKVSIEFSGVPSGSILTACCSEASDCGANAGSWPRRVSCGKIAKGSSRKAYRLPKGTGVVRFLLEPENPSSGAERFSEWTDAVIVTDDPVLSVRSAAPRGCTAADVSCEIVSLGREKSIAPVLEIAPAGEGSFAAAKTVAHPAIGGPGKISFAADGLVPRRSYRVRARAGKSVSQETVLTMPGPRKRE